MRVNIGSGLLPLNLLVFLTVAVVLFSSSDMVRIVLGFPLVLFFPGYTLGLALVPRKPGMGNTERIGLGFGVSIVVVALIGLALNYSPWGITLESVLYSVAAFILVVSVIAWARSRGLSEEERFGIEFQFGLPGWAGSRRDRVLSGVLVVAVLGAVGMLGYAIAAPRVESFTEFYILGMEEEMGDYPEELEAGEAGRVKVGITNHEHETVAYRVEVVVNSAKYTDIGPVSLDHEEEWQQEVSFTLEAAGDGQKVEFLLYRQGQDEFCHSLLLWVDVVEPGKIAQALTFLFGSYEGLRCTWDNPKPGAALIR